jgi:hypothetical protein
MEKKGKYVFVVTNGRNTNRASSPILAQLNNRGGGVHVWMTLEGGSGEQKQTGRSVADLRNSATPWSSCRGEKKGSVRGMSPCAEYAGAVGGDKLIREGRDC